MSVVLDWLSDPWERLNRARVQERLPHALLISGVEGAGKQQLAEQLASALLCEKPDQQGRACGCCAACGWLRAGTHPDLTLLEPEEPGKAIKVDQVRSLCSELGMTSHAGQYKVAIVVPADAMNVNASNSLLKTLEEPTSNTLLILVSASPARLSATIRSRCQQVQVSIPARPVAVDWLQHQGIERQAAEVSLQHAGGAPLKALELARNDAGPVRAGHLEQLLDVFQGRADPLAIANEWGGEGEVQALQWWRGWVQELIRWQQAGITPLEEQVAQKLQQVVETVDCRQLFDLSDRINSALNSVGSGLNRQLVMEDLMIFWAKMAMGTPYRFNSTSR